MAHEILSIKLCEMEDQIARMVSRIRLSETADLAQLRREILALNQECVENEMTLKNKLRLSRAGITSILAHAYGEIEQTIRRSEDALKKRAPDPDAVAEGKILLAEYALDFAAQAVNRALLSSMEAIEAQQIQQQEKGGEMS